MNADGSDARQVTDLAGNELDPAWSPDGSKIAFHHDPGGVRWSRSSLGVVNADGSGLATLADDAGYVGRPAWSPDGETIAFNIVELSYDPESFGNVEGATRQPIAGSIWAIGPDGSDLRKLHDGGQQTSDLSWLPDGGRIALSPDGRWVVVTDSWIVFADDGADGVTLYSMRADGSEVRPLLDGAPPPWSYPVIALSPDGRWVVVTDSWIAGQVDPLAPHPAFLISTDGTTVLQIGDGAYEPSWRPGRG